MLIARLYVRSALVGERLDVSEEFAKEHVTGLGDLVIPQSEPVLSPLEATLLFGISGDAGRGQWVDPELLDVRRTVQSVQPVSNVDVAH